MIYLAALLLIFGLILLVHGPPRLIARAVHWAVKLHLANKRRP